MARDRFVSALGTSLAICLGASCGSAPSPPSSNAPTRNNWQVIVTVETADVGFNLGITGIAFDGLGNLYLAEFDDDRIYKYSALGKPLAQWGGHGSDAGQLEAPDKLAFDAVGNLYVTEDGSGSAGANSRIQKFSATGVPLAQWGEFGSAPGQFDTPIGIAVDRQGDIYVADAGNHRIQKLSPEGQPLVQWHTVGSGRGETTEVGYDLALDASGNVYVSNAHPFSTGNDHIQKFSATGQLLATWGGTGKGPGKFSNPTGLTVDSKGDLFVVDSGNNRIQELSPVGQFVTQWEGPSSAPANMPQPLTFTSKVALDVQGNIYVSNGNLVMKLARS